MSITLRRAEPTPQQQEALKALKSEKNIFLTGPAGVGKTFVIQRYLAGKAKRPPVLASTGAAAVHIGGRTFHSFFGLGIMEGGITQTVERACKNGRVRNRIAKAKEVIIDEISMIHPQAFMAADLIAKSIRENTSLFGGLRLIVLGDFAQLPPVDRFEKRIPWLFEHQLWQEMSPEMVHLTTSMRTQHEGFVRVLNKVRLGQVDQEVVDFLNQRKAVLKDDFQGTVLFGRRDHAEAFNQTRLDQIDAPLKEFETKVSIVPGVQTKKESLVNHSPLPPILFLKEKALVMIRKNDPDGFYVNGSLGFVKKIESEFIDVELLSGINVKIPTEEFHILDGDGKIIATICNFPLTLGWATTIHKSQGASIDRLYVNLKGLWECGQAYVAISRARDPENLFLDEWSANSIKADPSVQSFYSSLLY